MRLYRKNFTRGLINQRIQAHAVDRDAIIWAIDDTNRLASVRIQGTNTNIQVPYHQVNRYRPDYLKVGACVQIRHKRGIRAYAEIMGPGRAIPTPVTGGAQLPTRDSVDAILTGMELEELTPLSMGYSLSAGTFRYNNIIYVYVGSEDGGYLMTDPPTLLMGSNPVVMGTSWSTVTIPAAPSAGYGRYDLIVVGTDGVADVVEGTPALLSTEPTMPSTPSGHILVDHIFIYGGQTTVDDSMIGKSWSAPIAEEVTCDVTGDIDGSGRILYTNGAEITLTISAVDQYGQAFDGDNVTCTCTLYCDDGEVYGALTGWRSDYAQAVFDSNLQFSYRRNDPVASDDQSPVFSIQSETGNFSYSTTVIALTS